MYTILNIVKNTYDIIQKRHLPIKISVKIDKRRLSPNDFDLDINC